MVTLHHSSRRIRRRPRTRGQALVEFALVVPVFLLLLAGMIDFGLGLYSHMTIVNAARDGGRLAATACSTVEPSCSDAVKARVTAAASGLSPIVDVDCTDANGDVVDCRPKTTGQTGVVKGDSVTVTASYIYRMIWPLAFGTQIPMTSSVTFMVE